jgi:hypothetical protein
VVMTMAGVLLWGCGGDKASSPPTSQGGSPTTSTAPVGGTDGNSTAATAPGSATPTTVQSTESTNATTTSGAADTTTTAAGADQSTTTSSTGGTSSTSSTSTSTSGSTGTTTSGAKIYGKVLDTDGSPVAGAKVKAVYDASDKHYKASGDNTIGTAIADAQGNYVIAGGSLALGSIVDVSVTAADHTSVLAYGTYDEKQEQVDFDNFGKTGGDRRMPVGSQMPPLPFEGLLPD